MTRKEFLTLTFTLVGTTAAAAACSSDSNATTGTAGTSGGAHGGSGGGAAGTSGSAGTTGAGGTGGGAAACSDPLPEVQSASDHTHTLEIPASTLNATTAQTIDTGLALAHMHAVTLEPADLATLKGGGSVTITSSVASAHTHVFTISCH
jgi:hypothetical protein